jgi:RNA polymerase sigma-70 factor (ECF subfamily)
MITNDTDLIFNESLNELQLPLFNFIFGMMPHKQDAEDILQKTNLILIEKQNKFDPQKGSFKTWAFQIARYQIMGHKTFCARSKVCFSSELVEVIADEAIDYETPHIRQKALNKCYKKLPKHMQKIAELRFKRDLSMKEISLCLNRPVGSITATLSRIRSNIMKCIKDAYVEAEQEFHNK